MKTAHRLLLSAREDREIEGAGLLAELPVSKLGLDGVEVLAESLDQVRKSVAKALQRGTGARGLRSIIEQSLLDIMFDLPSMTDVVKVVVDEKAIAGEGKPLLIYAEPRNAAKTQAAG